MQGSGAVEFPTGKKRPYEGHFGVCNRRPAGRRLSGVSEGFRPGNDLQKLCGDCGLAGLVVLKLECGDHLPGVFSGVFHRRHAGAFFCSARFQEDPPDLEIEVTGEYREEDPEPVRLINIVYGFLPHNRCCRKGWNREELLDEYSLRGYRLELVVDDVDTVEFAFQVLRDDLSGKSL